MGVVQILIKAKDLTGAAFASTKMKLAAMKTSVGKVQKGYMTLGSKISSVMSAAIMPIMLVVAAVYAIGRAVGSVTGQFGEFESAMKGVQKTTGMSDEEIAALGDDFKQLSREVPKSATELAAIGKIAGQLGIEGSENINSFTRTVAEASVAFDMNAADAALGLAALVKIYGKTIPEAVNLGSAVNELGNTTGASEEQILRFTTSLGPSAEMLGFTAGQAMGMGATLIELKMDASAAGTQMNSAFTLMGQRIPEVSEFLGISEQAFKDAFGEDPLGMLINLIDTIKEIEDPLDQNTQATAIFGRIGAKSIRGLMKDTGRLTENVDKATGAYEKGTAMHEEYLIFASSYESKLALIQNKANLAAIAVGEKLAPAILALGNALTDTVLPALGDLAIEIGKQTDETWPNFKNSVADAFAKILGDTNLVTWSSIMTGIGTVIGTALNVILLGLGFIIEANGPFLVAIGGMVACITEFVSDIQNLSVAEAFSNLKDNIFTALGNIKDEIAGKVSPIVDVISSGLGKVKEKVGPIFEEVKTVIFTKLGSIKDSLGEVLDPVKTVIHNKLAAIKDGLAEKLEPVTTIVLNALSGIKDKLDPIIDPLKTAIHTKLGGIKEGLEEKLSPVKTAIESVFTGAVGVIKLAFDDLPAAIGTIFTSIGEAITTFGENLPGFLGTSVADLGESFTDLGKSFTIPTENIEKDLGEATGYIDIMSLAVGLAKKEFEKIPAAVKPIAAATKTMEEDAKEDLDKLIIDVDGTKVSFDGLKGKVDDVVTEFGNFEDIAGDLIGLDWSVFTTLKDELPEIDKGIGDMKEAFGDLKTVLDNNIDNFDTIQKDLGDIEKSITPFVNNIAPGITAIGNFGKALSDTQSALGVFASMSEIDLEGMLGFESAVHSMVMGLDILEGQIERLLPTFGDIRTVIGNISETFVLSGGKQEDYADSLNTTFNRFFDTVDAGKLTFKEFQAIFRQNADSFHDVNNLGVAGEWGLTAYTNAARALQNQVRQLTGVRISDGEAIEMLIAAQGDQDKIVNDLIHSEAFLNQQLTTQTDILKADAAQLEKISGAIQPLINFMGTLNELYDSVFGEKAAVWDMTKIQEVFAAIESTIVLFGGKLSEMDFGTIIGDAVADSEEFMVVMREQGSELNMLTNYIDILLGYYVDLAELMGRLAEAEKDMGDEAFDATRAFEGIAEYIEKLNDFVPDLATALVTLHDGWAENSEAIMGSMTSFHELLGVVTTMGLALEDFVGKMVGVAQLDEEFLATGFGLLVTFVEELSTAIPGLVKALNKLDGVWEKNNVGLNDGIIAFKEVMKPIKTVELNMVSFGNLMATAGIGISYGFDSLIGHVEKLTAFTPRLALALSGLKTVWDENSGAIEDGTSAFSSIVDAISIVQGSIGDLITAEGDLETAADDATSAVDEESDALAGHSLSTSLDTTVASSALLQAATAALESAMGPLTGAVSAVAAVLSGELVSALGDAASAMASLAGGAYSSGASIAYSFADGIYGGMYAVEEAASALAAVVSAYLGVHSNTELGALSDLMEWGPNVVKTFKQGIQGEMVSLTKTLNDMSLGGVSMGGVAASSGGGGNISKKVYITIKQNISSKGDADYAIKEIERLMKKPQII